ncbi:hypothetical protein GGR51DRAFT_568289 [Nemania sp. FL0031]|nr:hypothetical protein GGR51DRAFT_568289 [Nemania sp. FL0031]
MSTGPADPTESPSLLGIPRRVRQLIYPYVLHLDLDWRPTRFLTGHIYPSNWDRPGNFVPRERCPCPWLNLRLTCRKLNNEVAAYMGRFSVRAEEENRTYRLDMSTGDYNGVFWGVLKHPTWRQIPCHPSVATTLVVTTYIEYERVYDPISDTQAKQYSLMIVRQFCLAMENIHFKGPFLIHRSPMPERAGFLKLEINHVFYRHTSGATLNGVGPRSLTQLDKRWQLIIERIYERVVQYTLQTGRFHIIRSMTPTPAIYWQTALWDTSGSDEF